VSNFDDKSSFGVDGIPVNILKRSIVYISEPLSVIVYCSIQTGVFPDELKIARVRPIFKSGDKQLLQNYRPISVLSSFSKNLKK